MPTWRVQADLMCKETVEVQAESAEDALRQYREDPTLRTRHEIVDVDEVKAQEVDETGLVFGSVTT